MVRRSPRSLRLECLSDRHAEAAPAVPDLAAFLQEGLKGKRRERLLRLAARVLGEIGPGAGSTLPVLHELASTHSSQQWQQLLKSVPEPRRKLFDETTYSDDEFIDAICKITR